MDQAISVMGQPGVAKLVEFNPVRAEDVHLPPGATFVIANSLTVSKKQETADKRCASGGQGGGGVQQAWAAAGAPRGGCGGRRGRWTAQPKPAAGLRLSASSSTSGRLPPPSRTPGGRMPAFAARCSYNLRVVECRLAAALMARKLGAPPTAAAAVKTLREVEPQIAAKFGPGLKGKVRARQQGGRRRAAPRRAAPAERPPVALLAAPAGAASTWGGVLERLRRPQRRCLLLLLT
jgi:hypothetical protein